MQGHLGAKANFCSSLWPWPPRSWPSCLRGLSLSTQGGQKRGHSAEVQGQSPKRLKGRSSCTCFVSQPRQGLGLQRCRSLIKGTTGGFLVVQWLRLHTPSVGGLGSIPGQGTTSHMPQLRSCTAKKKKKEMHKSANPTAPIIPCHFGQAM